MTKLTLAQTQSLPAFWIYIANRVKGLEEDAGYGGSMSDGGASRLRDKAECFRAGLDGSLPESLKKEFSEFEKQRDPEYQHFLDLRKKFEGK